MISFLKLIIRDWRGQLVTTLIWMALPAVILFAAIAQPWIAFELLSRDPIMVAMDAETCCRAYFGALSNVGVMFWFIAAGAVLVAGVAYWRAAQIDAAMRRRAAFFLSAGLLSLLLAVDDFFMFHEWLGEQIAAGEQLVLGAYGLAAAAFFVVFHRELAAETPLLLFLAAGFFAVGLGADVAVDMFGAVSSFVVEDGGKFLGIAAWAAYFFRYAVKALGGDLNAPTR